MAEESPQGEEIVESFEVSKQDKGLDIAKNIKAFKAFYEKGGRYDLAGQVPFLSHFVDYYAAKNESWLDLVKAHGLCNSCGIREPENPFWHEKAYEIELKYMKSFGFAESKFNLETRKQLIDSLKLVLMCVREQMKSQLSQVKHKIKGMEIVVENMRPPRSTKRDKLSVFCAKVQKASRMCWRKMLAFVSEIMKSAVNLLGQPPCDFAVVALGSFARCEVTPYSDLEYLFLIEDEKQTPYFEKLAIISYLIINNLRESNIKCYDIEELKEWFKDEGNSGFQIDGFSDLAGNIPTGRYPGINSLIKTVDHMVAEYRKVYLGSTTDDMLRQINAGNSEIDHLETIWKPYAEEEENMNNPEKIKSKKIGDFSSIISATVCVYGKKKLYRRFKLEIQEIEHSPVRKKLSLEMLRDDMRKFDFFPDESLSTIKTVKKDFFRFPSIILYDLKINFNLSSNTVWDVISDLKRGFVSDSFAQSMFVISCIAQYVRLDTYLFYKSQHDAISVLPTVNTDRTLAYFPRTLFLIMCSHLIPIKKMIRPANLSLNSFEEDVTFDEVRISQAYTYYYINDFNNCVKCYNAQYRSVTTIADTEQLIMYIRALVGAGHVKQALCHVQDTDIVSVLPVAKCFELTAYVLRHMGRCKEAKDFCKKNMMVLKDFTSAIAMAEICIDLGEFDEAEAQCQTAVKHSINSKKTETRNSYLLQAQKLKGTILLHLGKYKEARDMYENCLDAEKMQFGEFTCHQVMADSLDNLGTLHLKLANYKQASELFTKSFEMKKNLYGYQGVHQDIASSYNHLGDLYLGLAQYADALENYNRALEMRLSLFGDDALHKDIVPPCKSLAKACDDFGSNADALEIYSKASRKLLLPYGHVACHPDIASSYNNIANVYSNLGRHTDAIEYYRRALHQRLSLYGNDACHPEIANSYNNLAIVYRDLGQHADALEYHNKAFAKRLSLYGDDACHPEIANSYNNIAIVYKDLGRHADALEYHNKALSQRLSLYGDDVHHPDIADSYDNIATVYRELNRHDDALEYHNKALHKRLSLYGDDVCHPDIASSYNNIAMFYWDSGRHGEALEYHNKALKDRFSLYGDDACHPDIASSFNNIAIIHRDLGQHSDALEYHNKALDQYLSLYGGGACHPNIAASYNNIATVYCDLHRQTDALEYYDKALEMFISLHGDDLCHPDILATYNNKEIAYRDQCRIAEGSDDSNKKVDQRMSSYGGGISRPKIFDTVGRYGLINYLYIQFMHSTGRPRRNSTHDFNRFCLILFIVAIYIFRLFFELLESFIS